MALYSLERAVRLVSVEDAERGVTEDCVVSAERVVHIVGIVHKVRVALTD